MARPRTTAEDLFAKCDRSKGDNACWIWQGRVTKRYGVISVGNKTVLTHRAAWSFSKGEIPKGMVVCHSCGNPLCVNPLHLWLGTDDVRRRAVERMGAPSLLMREAVLTRLLSEGRALHRDDIAARVGTSAKMISPILAKLKRAGLLENPARGIWRAVASKSGSLALEAV